MKVKSYIWDTNDLLHKIKTWEVFEDGTLLVTMDLTSLYTNIPKKKSLRASMLALEKH